ncbi:prepronociceptin [Callorhinchus milii]|nr:prepronociceptin [Callorhinchus milii]|eukprot:gi/632979907/ref/XP_007906734.1/ PREDICTED: prepronociceptin-like [Callorhinchus milii]
MPGVRGRMAVLLVLLTLAACAQGQCPADCLTCDRMLQPAQRFNILVCALRCEGKLWDECRREETVKEGETVQPVGSWPLAGGKAAGLGVSLSVGQSQPGAWGLHPGGAVSSGPVWPLGDGLYLSPLGLSVSGKKRDLGPRAVEVNRSFQKRYGGFMGVRKSIRDWRTLNRQSSQKRYSKALLRRYFGLAARSSQYQSSAAQLNQ